MIRAITFDFWNTLYKFTSEVQVSEQRVREFQTYLQQYGYLREVDALFELFRQTWKYTHQIQLEQGIDIGPSGQIDYILKELGIQLLEAQWDEIYASYTTILRRIPPEMNDGVAETLPLLAQKYKLAVICNTGATPGSILRQFMEADGILQYFSVQVFSDEVQWAKPNGKIFEHTLAALGVKAQEAAHIGDDARTDVAGAHLSGMTAIWLAPEATEAVDDCDYHIRQVKELLDLF